MDLKSISRSLAASDFQIRQDGFKKISEYLSGNSMIYSDTLKLWKSLFYCKKDLDLWMADKEHEEIAEGLVSLIKSAPSKWEWINGFFETMRNEWDGIDLVRIDKFMYLVRVFLKSSLEHGLDAMGELQKVLKNLIEKCAFRGMGLIFHVADVYLEEMPSVPFTQKIEYIEPFISLMKSNKLNQVIDMVYNKILLKLVENRDTELKDWAYSQATSP